MSDKQPLHDPAQADDLAGLLGAFATGLGEPDEEAGDPFDDEQFEAFKGAIDHSFDTE